MRISRRIFLSALFLLSLLFGYAAFVEPIWLEVSHFNLIAPVESPLKIAHLTDLHFHRFGRLENNVLRTLQDEAPDVILVTGDTLESGDSIETAKRLFSELHPPLGTWAILGNWENWQQLNEKQLFQSFHVTLLKNETVRLRKDVALIGFDDSFSGKPDRSLANQDAHEFCVVMIHSPAFFEKAKEVCPLTLAGHTHGGQIRLPFIGALWLPPESGRYLSGWYESNGAKMYVSRGVGTSILPLRFLARPEVAIITVRSAN